MSSGIVVVIIVVAVIVIAAIVAFAMTARRRQLQQRFGPEYDRAVGEQDSRLRAEAELSERQRRVRKLNIQPLSEAARNRYLTRWQDIQEQFVDAPEGAVTDAYTLVNTVMRERGYPATDDEQAMADLSVEHATTVDHFRSAQEITRNVANGSVDTEDLRQAFIHYRELFADLLGDSAATLSRAPATTETAATETAGPAGTAAATEPVTDTSPDGMPVAEDDVPADVPSRVTTPATDPDDPSWQQGR
jgi:hypothetical protein